MSSSDQKTTSHCPINDLADEDLANIFKHLPPCERLLVSEVSKRWFGISRMPWCDVNHLDLSPISGEHYGAIIKQCPNLRSVFAKGIVFSLNQPHLLTGEHLSSVKLYHCSTIIPEQPHNENTRIPVLSSILSADLPNAPLKELVLCDFDIPARDSRGCAYLGTLPASLERLQINIAELNIQQRLLIDCGCGRLFFNGLGHLNQLTCLSLPSSHKCIDCQDEWDDDLRLELVALQNLRELCIGGDALGFALDLPRLEVLFLNDSFSLFLDEAELEYLATKHPALRILCITGSFNREFTIPGRRLFPNGFGSDHLPLLHVFLGKEPSEKIIFTKSSANALAIHPITEPLPEFLEKAELSPLFEGVWIAAQIKEGAKHGSNWWKYEGDTATTFRSADIA